MNPNVGTPNIHAIKASPVSTTNGHVVCFAICRSGDNEMEHWSINEDDIVYRKVCRLLNAKETSTISLPVFVVLIAIA